MDEKKKFAMVRCEFESDGTVNVRGDFDCNVSQSVFFLAEAVNAVANQLGLEPLEIAALALKAYESYRRVVDESENREES